MFNRTLIARLEFAPKNKKIFLRKKVRFFLMLKTWFNLMNVWSLLKRSNSMIRFVKQQTLAEELNLNRNEIVADKFKTTDLVKFNYFNTKVSKIIIFKLPMPILLFGIKYLN